MTRVGILAGGGKLPLLIGKSLIQAKYDVIFFCIEKFTDINGNNRYDGHGKYTGTGEPFTDENTLFFGGKNGLQKKYFEIL